MTDLKIVLVITKREYRNIYFDFFKKHKFSTVISEIGEGTATRKMLDLFGIENVKKVLFQIVCETSEVKPLFKDLRNELRFGDSGSGIGLTIPIENIGGISSLKYLIGDKPYVKKENSMENNEFNYSLIMTIVNTGYVDVVMNAARDVGAKGGTVLKARGTENDFSKFFGISISEEKQLVYIVCKQSDTKVFMQSIMEKAGPNTEAHGFIFSVPVDNVFGLNGLTNDDNE